MSNQTFASTMFMGNHKIDSVRRATIDKESSESSSDTEDSAENKPDRPKPGKLDLSQFDNITNAIGKLNVQPPFKVSDSIITASSKASASNVLKDSHQDTSDFINSSIDSSELINSRGAAIKQLNEILANKQPPGRAGILIGQSNRRNSSLDQTQHPSPTPQTAQSAKNNDKDGKKDKKKLRKDEKMEKRRLKEEERLRRHEKKMAAKISKSNPTNSDGSVGDDGIPHFIKWCIEFIELEGLDAEGIYRVPGNRAHVDTFVQNFKENPVLSISDSEIPVNAVATALKEFLSKKWGPIIPLALMDELTELSSITDRQHRIKALRQLLKKLPPNNYRLLKYVFLHFVKVSLNHSLNSMDSKNLAICWWPTLLPLHFNDMFMFEQMRPHLEESVQTMIDHYDFIFE